MIVLFASGFTMVALRSFQQLNVVLGRKAWVFPTSMLMAVVETTIIVKLAAGWDLERVLVYGMSAGCGCLTAMWIHRRMRHGQ